MTYTYLTRGEAAHEWLHELDLLGPLVAVDALEKLLEVAPDATDPTARHLAGFVAGRRGQIPATHRDVEMMSGVWAGLDLMLPAAGRQS